MPPSRFTPENAPLLPVWCGKTRHKANKHSSFFLTLTDDMEVFLQKGFMRHKPRLSKFAVFGFSGEKVEEVNAQSSQHEHLHVEAVPVRSQVQRNLKHRNQQSEIGKTCNSATHSEQNFLWKTELSQDFFSFFSICLEFLQRSSHPSTCRPNLRYWMWMGKNYLSDQWETDVASELDLTRPTRAWFLCCAWYPSPGTEIYLGDLEIGLLVLTLAGFGLLGVVEALEFFIVLQMFKLILFVLKNSQVFAMLKQNEFILFSHWYHWQPKEQLCTIHVERKCFTPSPRGCEE